MASAIAAAVLFAGCEKEVEKGVPGIDPYDTEFSSKGGVMVANSSTNHGESRFNYDNWRTQTTIDVYDKNKKECDEICLPWAKVTSTSMPSEYKHPEKEFLPDGTPRWELAFNFCDWVAIPGTDMFGLWDAHAQIMRIYTYIEQLPNQNAKSCFYSIRSTAPNYIDPNTRCWMPAEESIEGKTWPSVISGNLPTPSQYSGEIMPITGTLDGEVNPGWVCYEINFSSSLAKVNNDDNITFTLLGVEDIKFTATMDLQGTMNSYGGKITIPGNKTKAAGGILSSIGGLFSGIASAIGAGAKIDGPAGAAVAGVGIFGAITSCVGGCLTASQEAKDKTYQLDINFNVSLEGEINGSLTTNLGTTVNAVQIDYDVLFGNIIEHRAKSLSQGDTFTMGLWNFKNTPVIYIADDAMFQYSDDGSGCYFNTKGLYHPSFLDPRSLELAINTDDILFPLEDISRLNVLAYDFVFVSDKYSLPAQPYYDYYGVPQDSFSYSNQKTHIVNCDLKLSMLDPEVQPENKTFTRNGQRYYYSGTTDVNTDYGMDVYDMVCTPIIHKMPNTTSTYKFDQLGVVGVFEVEYKNGDKRVFADRFLPRIKAFHISEADSLKNVMSNASLTQTIAGISVENPLFEAQKSKAVRVLDSLSRHSIAYPAVELDNSVIGQNVGIQIRAYSKESDGIVIVTNENGSTSGEPTLKCLEWLHDVIEERGDWNAINNRLEELGMASLNMGYYFKDGFQDIYNIQTGSEYFRLDNQAGSIRIFTMDSKGKLTKKDN